MFKSKHKISQKRVAFMLYMVLILLIFKNPFLFIEKYL